MLGQLLELAPLHGTIEGLGAQPYRNHRDGIGILKAVDALTVLFKQYRLDNYLSIGVGVDYTLGG